MEKTCKNEFSIQRTPHLKLSENPSISACMQQDEQSSGQHKGLHPQTGRVSSVTTEMTELQRCQCRDDRVPSLGNWKGCTVWRQTRHRRRRMARGDLGVMHKSYTNCAGNCFFPSLPEKVEQQLNTKNREILSFISEARDCQVAWVFGVPHGASLQLQWSQERCKTGNLFSWPCPAGTCLLCYTMYSPDCAP